MNFRNLFFVLSGAAYLTAAVSDLPELRRARDRQDRGAIDQIIGRLQTQSKTDNSAEMQYEQARAYSYAAELAMEQRDKRKAESYAEAGVDFARKATEAKPADAEYHRMLGELCGQIIPANPIFGGLKYGQCARDEVNKAIQLDPKSAIAYLSRGVGNYYLPEQFGGGVNLAIQDLDKAIALNPALPDAYLWKGIALRKLNRNGDARQAIEKAVQLSPDWAWAKEQLAKTPAQ